MSIKVPRVPNFIEQENGSWVPLCALSNEGIEQMSKAWMQKCFRRKEEQSKNPDFFYSKVKPEQKDEKLK